MLKLSLFIVLFAVCSRAILAQNGYNYDRPDVGLNRGPTGGGYPSSTPSYPTGGSAGYPSGRPSGPSFPPQSDEFPGSQRPGVDAGYPSGPATGGAPYPASGVPQTRPSGPGVSRPTAGGIPGGIGGGNFGPQSGSSGGSSSSSGSFGGSGQQDESSSQEGDYSAIPGEPGTDYPIYSEIPETSFDCNQQEFPGYYADVEAQCQVFHICALNRTFNFLCPNGTIFSQETLVCVWWNQFDCNSAPGLFANNANLYDYSITGSSQSGGDANRPGTVGTGPSSAPYPSTPSFGTGPTGPYPAAADTPINPSGPSVGFGSTPSAFPTQQGNDFGGYPGGSPSPTYAPPSNVPSQFAPQQPQGFGPQQPQGNDAPYPASGQPQTPPTREYLPPRRG